MASVSALERRQALLIGAYALPAVLLMLVVFVVPLGNVFVPSLTAEKTRTFTLPTVKLLFNRVGVILGMSHFLVPFMVFPILTNLINQPRELPLAAALLGGDER